MERQFTIHAAKTNLSKLIEAALAGDDVVIAKGKKPVVRLVAIPAAKFKIGVLKGKITDPVPDFLEPLSDSESEGWEGGR
jgi:antitoxin (DNA-binding transcriptional repressor) of toxin-antitoxin stability system